MQPFAYVRPDTLDAALAALRDGASASEKRPRLLAGGTTLVDLMKLGVERPDTLIDVTSLRDLDFVSGDRRMGLTIGALARMSDVAAHPAICRDFPALSESLLIVSQGVVYKRIALVA